MTGAPAETWRKFRFATAPAWAYVLLLLVCTGVGLLIIAVLMWAVSFRATGYLPLTRASRRKLALATWIPIGLIVLTFVLWIAAAILGLGSNDPTASTVAGVLLVLGLLSFIAGVAGRLVISRIAGPRARVMERQPGQYDQIVELRNVHPAFVMAVNEMHLARAAYYAGQRADPNQSLLPGST